MPRFFPLPSTYLLCSFSLTLLLTHTHTHTLSLSLSLSLSASFYAVSSFVSPLFLWSLLDSPLLLDFPLLPLIDEGAAAVHLVVHPQCVSSLAHPPLAFRTRAFMNRVVVVAVRRCSARSSVDSKSPFSSFSLTLLCHCLWFILHSLVLHCSWLFRLS